MAHQTGESKQGCLRVDFDRRLKLEFHGSKVTTDAGLLAYRELDASVELTAMAGDVLADSRTGKNGRHGMVGQFRLYRRLRMQDVMWQTGLPLGPNGHEFPEAFYDLV